MMNTYHQISFYIPRLSVTCTAENIKYIFRTSGIGEVKRVDFTSIVSRENMVSNYNTNEWQSAFVHIVYMYDTVIAKVIMQNITAGAPYKFWFKPGLFWLILKNTNPIPDTIQNIHQIAENARLLEERVVKQEEQIAKQSAEIDRLQETVYQLIGTVFNHTYQSDDIYGNVNNMLYGKFYTKGWLYDENDDGANDDDTDKEEGEVDEESQSLDSSSTHSSMPGLVADGDLDDEQSQSSNSSTTHSSMPVLMTNSELEDDQTTCSDTSDSSDSMPELVANFVLVDADDDDDTCSL
jgi:hypothetical protein